MLIPHFAKRVFENKVLTALFIILSLLSIYFYVFSLSKKALVKIDIHSNITTYFKIYWAKTDQMYNEKRSASVFINDVQTRYLFSISDLKSIGKIRIDPSQRGRKTAKILIKKILISQVGYEPILIKKGHGLNQLKPLSGIQKMVYKHNGLLVVSSENDPQIEVYITPQKQSLFFGHWVRILLTLIILLVLISWVSSKQDNYSYIAYLMVFILAQIVIMAYTSRPNSHPDEYVHLRAARYYEKYWTPPAVCDPETKHTYSPYGISRLNSREIVYLIAGKFSSIFSFLLMDSYQRLRLFNIFLFFILVLLCFKSTAFRIAVAPLLISPQIWYVFSYFNSDAFSVFCIFILIHQILIPKSLLHRFLNQTLNMRTICLGIVLGLVFSILFLLKKNFYSFILFVALYFVWWLYFEHIKLKKANNGLVKRLGLILMSILFGYGIQISTDFYYYGFNKKEQIERCQDKFARSPYRPGTDLSKKNPHLQLRERGVSIKEVISKYKWGEKSFRSAFGVYDYLRISAPKSYYTSVKYMLLLFFAFVFLSLLIHSGTKEKVLFLILLICSISLIGAHLWRCWEVTFQAQGRYLLPIAGMMSLFLYSVKHILYKPIIHLFILLMFLLSSYSFIFVALVNIPNS